MIVFAGGTNDYALDDSATQGGAVSIVARGHVPTNVLQAMLSRERLRQIEE